MTIKLTSFPIAFYICCKTICFFKNISLEVNYQTPMTIAEENMPNTCRICDCVLENLKIKAELFYFVGLSIYLPTYLPT